MVPSVLSEREFFPSLFLMEPLGKPALSSSLATVLSLLTLRAMFFPPFFNYLFCYSAEFLFFKLHSLYQPDNSED
jgi:hypothetical protein